MYLFKHRLFIRMKSRYPHSDKILAHTLHIDIIDITIDPSRKLMSGFYLLFASTPRYVQFPNQTFHLAFQIPMKNLSTRNASLHTRMKITQHPPRLNQD